MSSTSAAFTAQQHLGRVAMHKRRKVKNALALMMALCAMAFGVFWLLWILWETFRLGVGGLALSVFTQMTPPPQSVRLKLPRVPKA